jgi:hypothetical protein
MMPIKAESTTAPAELAAAEVVSVAAVVAAVESR